MSKRYYIQDTRSHGDLVSWWCPNRKGYTTNLDLAGVYEEMKANEIARIRGTDIPRLKQAVDALAFRAVSSEAKLPSWRA